MDATDRFVGKTHLHGHAADVEVYDLLKARGGIKRFAKDTAEKSQNIITANITRLKMVARCRSYSKGL